MLIAFVEAKEILELAMVRAEADAEAREERYAQRRANANLPVLNND